MALIKNFEKITIEKSIAHKNAKATYSIVFDGTEQFLQIDSYGSDSREIKGGKSQSMRFSPEAIIQLREILKNFP